uniref:SHC adaptor protein 4 n=1 Tax=Salarias fasciatus TaxID=181472 RepID=A0A672G5I8_SALFA
MILSNFHKLRVNTRERGKPTPLKSLRCILDWALSSSTGMLKRTKYSRLRNDSLTSLEDPPQRMLPVATDLCLDSDFAQLDPETPAPHGPSTLRDFIPRVANIRLQSPLFLRGLRGQADASRGKSIPGDTKKPLTQTEWNSGNAERVCTSLNVPLSPEQNLIHPLELNIISRCSQKVKRFVSSQYMGSVEVTQSMRTLDFNTRMQVTREAISRLCETTSGKASVKTKRPVCKGLSAVLGQINLQFSGSRIILTVSTDSLTLISASSLQKLAYHPMRAISFASGGDPGTVFFFSWPHCYSGNSDCLTFVRLAASPAACHILECPPGRASEVISSIGQAFETRFRQLLSQTPSLLTSSPRFSQFLTHRQHDYYNVIPGKTPPAGGVEDVRITQEEGRQDADIQEVKVCLSGPASLYENCAFTEGALAPPAGKDHPQQLQSSDVSVSRKQAESLLTCSGDFLVRESSSASGQYVLSGMEGATVRHLLLVDPHGQVRTRDQVFLSVGHLVRFHMESQMPIVSGSSELCLKKPILQTQ